MATNGATIERDAAQRWQRSVRVECIHDPRSQFATMIGATDIMDGLAVMHRGDHRRWTVCRPFATRAAFIDPDGRFIPVAYAGHDEYAEAIHGLWTDDLIQRGWIHLSSGDIGARDIGQAQLDTIHEYIDALRPVHMIGELLDANLRTWGMWR